MLSCVFSCVFSSVFAADLDTSFAVDPSFVCWLISLVWLDSSPANSPVDLCDTARSIESSASSFWQCSSASGLASSEPPFQFSPEWSPKWSSECSPECLLSDLSLICSSSYSLSSNLSLFDLLASLSVPCLSFAASLRPFLVSFLSEVLLTSDFRPFFKLSGSRRSHLITDDRFSFRSSSSFLFRSSISFWVLALLSARITERDKNLIS